jgi:hypothetical protein
VPPPQFKLFFFSGRLLFSYPIMNALNFADLLYSHPFIFVGNWILELPLRNAMQIVVILYYLGNNDKEKSLYIFNRWFFFWLFSICGWVNPKMLNLWYGGLTVYYFIWDKILKFIWNQLNSFDVWLTKWYNYKVETFIPFLQWVKQVKRGLKKFEDRYIVWMQK